MLVYIIYSLLIHMHRLYSLFYYFLDVCPYLTGLDRSSPLDGVTFPTVTSMDNAKEAAYMGSLFFVFML